MPTYCKEHELYMESGNCPICALGPTEFTDIDRINVGDYVKVNGEVFKIKSVQKEIEGKTVKIEWLNE